MCTRGFDDFFYHIQRGRCAFETTAERYSETQYTRQFLKININITERRNWEYVIKCRQMSNRTVGVLIVSGVQLPVLKVPRTRDPISATRVTAAVTPTGTVVPLSSVVGRTQAATLSATMLLVCQWASNLLSPHLGHEKWLVRWLLVRSVVVFQLRCFIACKTLKRMY